MIGAFQQYLVDKGFNRFYFDTNGEKVSSDSMFISTYSRLGYYFEKDNHICFYGLSQKHLPAEMDLGSKKIVVLFKVNEQRIVQNWIESSAAYHILFNKWKEDKFDIIYDTFISNDRVFVIDTREDEPIVFIGDIEEYPPFFY